MNDNRYDLLQTGLKQQQEQINKLGENYKKVHDQGKYHLSLGKAFLLAFLSAGLSLVAGAGYAYLRIEDMIDRKFEYLDTKIENLNLIYHQYLFDLLKSGHTRPVLTSPQQDELDPIKPHHQNNSAPYLLPSPPNLLPEIKNEKQIEHRSQKK